MEYERIMWISMIHRLIGGIIGMFVGLIIPAWHNAHVSIWTGGWRFNTAGYFACIFVGAVLGAVVGDIIQRHQHDN